MTDRDKKSPSSPNHDPGNDDIIPGRHGRHGGSEESEGSPQKHSREDEPPKHNGSDGNRH